MDFFSGSSSLTNGPTFTSAGFSTENGWANTVASANIGGGMGVHSGVKNGQAYAYIDNPINTHADFKPITFTQPTVTQPIMDQMPPLQVTQISPESGSFSSHLDSARERNGGSGEGGDNGDRIRSGMKPSSSNGWIDNELMNFTGTHTMEQAAISIGGDIIGKAIIGGPIGSIVSDVAHGFSQGKDPLNAIGDVAVDVALDALGPIGLGLKAAGWAAHLAGIYDPNEGAISSIRDAYNMYEHPEALPKTESGVAMFEHKVNEGYRSGGNREYTRAANQANHEVHTGQINHMEAVSRANQLAAQSAGYTSPQSSFTASLNQITQQRNIEAERQRQAELERQRQAAAAEAARQAAARAAQQAAEQHARDMAAQKAADDARMAAARAAEAKLAEQQRNAAAAAARQREIARANARQSQREHEGGGGSNGNRGYSGGTSHTSGGGSSGGHFSRD